MDRGGVGMSVQEIETWVAARRMQAERHGMLARRTDPDAAEGGCGVV